MCSEGHVVGDLALVDLFLQNIERAELRIISIKVNQTQVTIHQPLFPVFLARKKSEKAASAEMSGRLTHRVVECHVEEDAVDEIVLRDVGHARGQHRVHEVGMDHLLSHRARARGSQPRRRRSQMCIWVRIT